MYAHFSCFPGNTTLTDIIFLDINKYNISQYQMRPLFLQIVTDKEFKSGSSFIDLKCSTLEFDTKEYPK